MKNLGITQIEKLGHIVLRPHAAYVRAVGHEPSVDKVEAETWQFQNKDYEGFPLLDDGDWTLSKSLFEWQCVERKRDVDDGTKVIGEGQQRDTFKRQTDLMIDKNCDIRKYRKLQDCIDGKPDDRPKIEDVPMPSNSSGHDGETACMIIDSEDERDDGPGRNYEPPKEEEPDTCMSVGGFSRRLSAGKKSKEDKALQDFADAKVEHKKKLSSFKETWDTKEFALNMAPHDRSLVAKVKAMKIHQKKEQIDEATNLAEEWSVVRTDTDTQNQSHRVAEADNSHTAPQTQGQK